MCFLCDISVCQLNRAEHTAVLHTYSPKTRRRPHEIGFSPSSHNTRLFPTCQSCLLHCSCVGSCFSTRHAQLLILLVKDKGDPVAALPDMNTWYWKTSKTIALCHSRQDRKSTSVLNYVFQLIHHLHTRQCCIQTDNFDNYCKTH